MLGLSSLSSSRPWNAVSSSILPPPPPLIIRRQSAFSLKIRRRISRKSAKLVVFASKESEKEGKEVKGGDGELGKDQRPLFNFRWGELLLDADPDNILAVALTGLLTWASVQVLLQLFFISLAILVAALKYSFIAAILVFILITLL